ncbi:hypothetical protein AB1Y20_021351 [Prymnesium parvum]|uniref:MRH domain-containing protein n=1 Tax=Prymnesium parvum TaxID=97485 RepID=A0AB34JJW1_PRYPA
MWKSDTFGATFDLAPLAKPREVSFGSIMDTLPGLLGIGRTGGPQQSIVIAICDAQANPSCNGERVPGILVERARDTYPSSVRPDTIATLIRGGPPPPSAVARCHILGRRPTSGAAYSLLDPDDPAKGLQVRFEKGDVCREGQRTSVLVMLHCDLSAHEQSSQVPGRIQRRDPCQWVVSFYTAAACPINVGELCAPNCPRTWLGDGECDPGCNSAACDSDGGDCEHRPQGVDTTGQCAAGCMSSWRGDKECDEECNTAACDFDDGDCVGMCAPGCAAAWRNDGVCDDECNTGTYNWDDGDCLRNGRKVARERMEARTPRWQRYGHWRPHGQFE